MIRKSDKKRVPRSYERATLDIPHRHTIPNWPKRRHASTPGEVARASTMVGRSERVCTRPLSVQVVISTIIARFRRNQRGAAIFSGKLANGKSSTKNHGEMYEGPVSWHPKDVANVLISVGSNGSPPSNRYRAQSQYVEKGA